MKGWIERVFTPGVTYNVEGIAIHPLLKNTSADIIATQRGIRPVAWYFGNHHLGILTRNLFVFCGIKKRKIITLGGIGLIPLTNKASRRQKFLEKVVRAARSLT